MADPPSYDQDLLNRLNALKKSNITLNTEECVELHLLRVFKAEALIDRPFPSQSL
jgi:hypothetical protein